LHRVKDGKDGLKSCCKRKVECVVAKCTFTICSNRATLNKFSKIRKTTPDFEGETRDKNSVLTKVQKEIIE